MAFSYWFHPPDNLCPDASGLRQPYTSQFWPALWAAQLLQMQPHARAQLDGSLHSPSDTEDEQTESTQPAGGCMPAFLGLPVSRLWWRHPSWLASCGRRRHQFLLMRRVRQRTC
jgi:hypothetical protein